MNQIKEIATELGDLLEEKGTAYGDSITTSGDILIKLFPEGIKPHQYHLALILARISDKLCRIVQDVEDVEEPWLDVAGYALRMVERERKK